MSMTKKEEEKHNNEMVEKHFCEMAFPMHVPDLKRVVTGLSRRQLFAAMAMQGMISSGKFGSLKEGVAHIAIEYADALIVELNKEK